MYAVTYGQDIMRVIQPLIVTGTRFVDDRPKNEIG
jgi:hypothetical protein